MSKTVSRRSETQTSILLTKVIEILSRGKISHDVRNADRYSLLIIEVIPDILI